ncbi:SubName: Full=Uncharacterized protein {ECO:0000313/EMBL:CCA72212.1} [Serendipita indica DSM 11827]|uniref:Uncharacterized protein n=1 Tax=Serendipita indica (strain DSM 11827) TaxID=1109443 RepID=G4TLL8_SERID|nr:SubName: Full=Uncharacterized protein {ECO:0000313/EMBL:CCA72212.1} [Serendipita indica DSM 11827]CCA72212.1 hypothetical protein PIIN_06147 [Serendipita indica DSM 11827]
MNNIQSLASSPPAAVDDEMSSSSSPLDGESSRARYSLPVTLYERYHGEDSEQEVEEELRERELNYGFRASRTRPFPSSASSQASQSRRLSPTAILSEDLQTAALVERAHLHDLDGSLEVEGTPQAHTRMAVQASGDHAFATDRVARLPTELYSLIAAVALSERPIAKIHTFRKSPWQIIVGATLASRALRAAFMHAWFRVLRIRQVGDFNYIDQKMPWMFPWVREIHWHYRFPISCNETHVLPKFIHAVLISFKTSDNRLGNEHYMTMVHKAMPYLGTIPNLTRLSLTCRSLFDVHFLTSLASSWPALECLRLARPLKDDSDMKAYILYRYEFDSYHAVIERLVSCLRRLKYLAYIAIDLAFADFRLMRATHVHNGLAPEIPADIKLPRSLRPPSPLLHIDPDGDTVMNDGASVTPSLTNGIAALNVSESGSVPAPLTAANLAFALSPTAHDQTSNPLECPLCLRTFRTHSYYIEHQVAQGLGRGIPSLAAARFRASFPVADAGDAKENKWLIKRALEVDPMTGMKEEKVVVWVPRWE